MNMDTQTHIRMTPPMRIHTYSLRHRHNLKYTHVRAHITPMVNQPLTHPPTNTPPIRPSAYAPTPSFFPHTYTHIEEESASDTHTHRQRTRERENEREKSEKARKIERVSERKSDAHTHIHTHTHARINTLMQYLLLCSKAHTRAHTHICAHRDTQKHSRMFTCAHGRVRMCVHPKTHTHTHTRTCTHTMQIHACAHANVTNQMKLRQLLTMLQLPCAKKPRFPILIPQFTPLHRCKVSEL